MKGVPNNAATLIITLTLISATEISAVAFGFFFNKISSFLVESSQIRPVTLDGPQGGHVLFSLQFLGLSKKLWVYYDAI